MHNFKIINEINSKIKITLIAKADLRLAPIFVFDISSRVF